MSTTAFGDPVTKLEGIDAAPNGGRGAVKFELSPLPWGVGMFVCYDERGTGQKRNILSSTAVHLSPDMARQLIASLRYVLATAPLDIHTPTPVRKET